MYKLHEVAYIPMIHIHVIPFLSMLAPMVKESSSLSRVRLGPDLKTVLYNIQVPPESRLLQHYNPFMGYP